MTPQELKNSILQLAIQGKLVEQRPEEGTGEEVVKKIYADRHNQVKNKIIKKEKELPIVQSDDYLFDIPENWVWERIGNVGSWASGATPSRTNSAYYNGDIPWLKTGDLNDGDVIEVPEYITEIALEKTSVRLNPIGSVLMAMYGATIGKLGILQIEATTNQACCACIPFDGMYNKYLFYYLMASRKTFIKMGEGGAQPNISKEKIVNFPIPLPPLAEQKRIAAKIEELLPYIDHYEQAWSKLEEFNKRFPGDMQKSILQMAIQGKLVEQRPEEGTGEELYQQIQDEKKKLIAEGKIKKEKPLSMITEKEIPFEIPESWKWVRLRDICTKIVDGDHNPPAGISTTSDYLMLSAQNINNNKVVELEKVRYLTKEVFEQVAQRTNAQKGDIFFTIVGTLGRSCVYEGGFNICFQRSVSVLTTLTFNYYLKYMLDSAYIQSFMIKNATGTAQKGFYLKQVEQLVIPLPPLAEQKRIVAKLEELLPLCERLK